MSLALPAAFPGSGAGATLQDLLDGAIIGIGNQIEFFDWQALSLDSTGALPDLSLIEVHALTDDPANPGLQFVANGQLSTSGVNAIDLVLEFGVQISGNSNTITGHALSLTGIDFGGSGGVAYISDGLVNGSDIDVGSALAIADNENDAFQFSHTSSFSPQIDIFVTTNIFLQGLSNADTINLSTFTQRFAQTGPPVVPGDFNFDGIVDAVDYVVWRKTDGNQSGYNLWRANFGRTPSGSGSSANTMPGAAGSFAAPEPTGWMLLAAALPAIASRRRSRSRMSEPNCG